MKKIILLFLILPLAGCSLLRPPAADPNYAAYARTMQVQFQAAREPLVNIQLSDEGKITGIVVNQPAQLIQVQQKKDHPGYRLAGSVVKMAGIVGSIFMVGESLEGVIEASQGNETYINSQNSMDENTGTVDLNADYSDYKNDSVDTTVDTAE